MTASIDKKIVEMVFENAGFEQKVGESVSAIDKLKQSLQFRDSARGFADINAAAGRVDLGAIASGVESISQRFSAMGIIAMTVLANITSAAYNAASGIAKALVIDPIRTGLEEYETKLNSVQTILANTQKEGTNLDIVTEALNELNTYADKTIYNFREMTRNIGTFTAAGVKLDTSVSAIKGIANLAAISGSNSQQASTAMYQLSQALSSGTVKLMDWNSVVNAGMGGQVFQDAIMETAKLHGVAIDQMIEEEGSFRETLQRGWFTSEILTDTLAKFTGDLNEDQLRTMGYTEEQIAGIIKMGQTANDAATKVKTFTQLFDTLKEAAQSGWAQTWELIIGDFNEAKDFLSQFNDWFGGILGAAADTRNTLLQGWKDLGGRTQLLEAFQNILNSIVTILNPLRDGMREIFPRQTSEGLFALTQGLVAFTKGLIASQPIIDNVKRISRGFFAALDIGRMFVSALAEQLLLLIKSFSSTGATIFDSVGDLGDWIVELRNSIKESGTFIEFFSKLAASIRPVITGVVDFFGLLLGGFKDTEKIGSAKEAIESFFGSVNERLASFGKVGKLLQNILGFITKLAQKAGPILSAVALKLGDIMSGIFESLTAKLENWDTGKVIDIINKGLTGGLLVALTSFVTGAKKLTNTDNIFGGILGSIKSFIESGGSIFGNVSGILNTVKETLESYQKNLKADTLLKISGAIALLVVSIIALTLIDPKKLAAATGAITAMFAGLIFTLNAFDKAGFGGAKMVTMVAALLGISAAVALLSTSVLLLSTLDPVGAAQGVLAVGSLLALLVLFKTYAGAGGFAGMATGMLALSVGLIGLSFAIRSLGSIDPEKLALGLLGMAGALTIVGVAMQVMSSNITGAGALLLAAGAILILAMAFKAMENLSLEQVGVALLAIAGVFTVLGLAGLILAPVIPTIGLLALSILAIGVAVLAVGAGIGLFAAGIAALATGIVALAGITAVGMAAISLVVTGLATLLPMLATHAAKALDAFIEQMAKTAPNIALSLLTIAVAILDGLATLLPKVVTVILDFLTTILTSIKEKLPEIQQTGYDILIGIMQGVRDNIGQVIDLSTEIATEFIDGLARQLPAIADSGWNLIISYVDAMRDGVQDNLPRLMSSIRELGLAIVEGVLTGIRDGTGTAVDAIRGLGQILIDTFKNLLGIRSPSSVFIDLARQIIDGLIQGLKDNLQLAINVMTTLATTLISKVKDRAIDFYNAGRDLVTGLANGIKDYIGTAVANAQAMAQNVLTGISTIFDEHSPSRKTFESGKNVVLGLANGILKYASTAVGAGEQLGDQTLSGFNAIVSKISDAVNSNLDFQPTIAPVMDMTDILRGGKLIDGLFSDPKRLNVSTDAAIASRISANQTTPATDTVEGGQTTANNISLVQNNYSPVALSRYEIYRQTRNQLLQVKGLEGV